MSTPPRLVVLLLAAGLVSACAGQVDTSAPAAAPAMEGERPTVTVHRTTSCECCGKYEEYLAQHGYEVVEYEVVEQIHEDLTLVKDRFGIPDDEASCHTNEIDGYVAEGHVPIEAIEDLLREQPDIDGITLAGMPSGSPGMPGEQEAPFEVAAIDGSEVIGAFGGY